MIVDTALERTEAELPTRYQRAPGSDTALERAEAELSNAVSTSAWKSHTGEGSASMSALESSGLSCRDCYVIAM